MFDSMRAVMREPLLHFLVAGAGLFLLFSFAAGPDSADNDEIVVSSGQIEHLTTLFVKTWQRPPTDAELRGLIDSYILEEVLYREAVAIGLDQDDTIIRRRLKQKMEFLVDDFSAANPSTEDLQQFLDDDPERFRAEARISFEHVYLADPLAGEAESVLAALQGGEALDSDISSVSGLLPRRFDDVSETNVAGQFGREFSAALFALDIGQWTGPVQSPFGMHLVRIDHIVEARVPLLDEILDVVRREWLVDRRQAAQATLYDQLRAKYMITIEEFDDSSP